MAGETDLQKILQNLSPTIRPESYVFCTEKEAKYGDLAHSNPIACCIEEEGLTLILSQQNADKAGLFYETVFRCICLNIHSSLEAVGLTAVVSTALAKQGISANMMAGYFHDYIFVPADQIHTAHRTIINIASQSSQKDR